jgi:cell wall-associated NlpC family hydrolase
MEVGTPWPIDAPGFQSGGDFQSRIHVAFARETAGRESGVFAAALGEAAAAPGHTGTVGFLQAVRAEESAAAAPAGDLGAAVEAAAAVPAATGASAVAVAAVAEAEKYLGTPYLWGGEAPETGFDCSGLTQYVYSKLGVDLPRVAEDQFGVGTPIEQGQLQPGDLVFFQDETGYIYHEGIYIGNGQFLHAPSTGDVVKVSDLSDPYYTERFAGARRVADLADPNVPIPADLMPAVQAAVPAGVPLPEPEAVGRQSGVFAAVSDETAAPAARRVTVGIQAVQPEEPEVPPAAAPTEPPPDAALIAAGPDAYPGDGAPKEAIAAWMSRRAQEAGLPPELPVMAGLVESGLFNNPGGDADSVGFFQMRVSIWDQGAYAGYQTDPEKQLQWFIDQALALREKRIEQGVADFGQDPGKWGEWIADVERPAEEYRGRYQLRLDEARGLLAGAPPPATA